MEMKRIFCLLTLLLAGFSVRAADAPHAPEPAAAAESVDENPSTLPLFAGSDLMAFRRWVFDRLVFPASQFRVGEKATVKVSFTVGRDGRLRKIRLHEGSDKRFGALVREAVEASPAWTPATEAGKTVECPRMLRFDFRLDNVAPEGSAPLLRAEDRTVFRHADVMPLFGGEPGIKPFIEWIREHAEDSLGHYRIRMIIEKDGGVSSVKVRDERDPRQLVPREFIELLRNAPAWTPGTIHGEPVRVEMLVVVDFAEPTPEDSDPDTLMFTEVMPQFQGGGISDFRRWVMKNLQYPPAVVRDKISGRVVASFVIQKDGHLDRIAIVLSPDSRLSDAVERTLRKSPRWSPGEQDGRRVRVKFTLPVDFSF